MCFCRRKSIFGEQKTFGRRVATICLGGVSFLQWKAIFHCVIQILRFEDSKP